MYEAGGKTHVGRILGCETDVITMDDTGTLLVNGTAQTGEIAFPTYAKKGITYPYTVPKAVCSFWEITGHRQKTAVNSAPSPQRM